MRGALLVNKSIIHSEALLLQTETGFKPFMSRTKMHSEALLLQTETGSKPFMSRTKMHEVLLFVYFHILD
jgi:hypothetical protein